MSDPKAEQSAKEAAGWAGFLAALEPIPRERWTQEGVLPGWSVKDLLQHVSGWMVECTEHLVKMREGTFVDYDEDDAEVDRRNAAFVAEAAAMDVEAVWSGLLATREVVLRRWDEMPDGAVNKVAIDWFAGETYRHYREHLPELRRFAG
jgi:hypothetical protein